MTLLTRYVLSRYLGHLAVLALLMAGLYLAVDMPERVGQGVGVLARIPLILSHVLPVAAGAALLSAFHALCSSGAIVTLRGSGIGWSRLLGPAIAGGVLAVAVEAALSTAVAPAALAWGQPPVAGQAPAWFVDGGDVVHRAGDGTLTRFAPGEPPRAQTQPLPRDLSDRLDLVARRVPTDRASVAELVTTARAAASTGHDPRAEHVELWTRLLLPVATLGLLATCVVAVRREQGAWRGCARLLVGLVVGWLGLSVATQLALNSAVPAPMILVMPAALLAGCAVSPWP